MGLFLVFSFPGAAPLAASSPVFTNLLRNLHTVHRGARRRVAARWYPFIVSSQFPKGRIKGFQVGVLRFSSLLDLKKNVVAGLTFYHAD